MIPLIRRKAPAGGCPIEVLPSSSAPMDDVAGGVAALGELIAALVSLLVDLILLAVELLALVVEMLIWGVAALIGRSRPHPRKRKIPRPAILRRGSSRLLAYLLIFGGLGLFLAGQAVYRHYFTAEITLRTTLGLHASGIEVEWVGDAGKTKHETIKSPARYLKHRWNELRVVDDAYFPEAIELSHEDQEVRLRSRMVEKLTEASKERIAEAIGEKFGDSVREIDTDEAIDFLRDKFGDGVKQE